MTIGAQDAHKHLSNIVDMDGQAHVVLVRQGNRRATGRLGHALHVIHRAPHLVGTRHVGRTHPGDRQAIFLTVILGLPLVEHLVHGVLIVAVTWLVFVH